VLKQIVNFGTLLICAEGTRLLREDGAGETPQAHKAPRRLPEPPAESEVPGVEINRQVKSTNSYRIIANNSLFLGNNLLFDQKRCILINVLKITFAWQVESPTLAQ
jgi:hypothetical protein